MCQYEQNPHILTLEIQFRKLECQGRREPNEINLTIQGQKSEKELLDYSSQMHE